MGIFNQGYIFYINSENLKLKKTKTGNLFSKIDFIHHTLRVTGV